MADKKYDNVWTKLKLGGLRGNPIFSGIWRALRVGGVTALLFFVKKVLPGLDLVPDQYLPIIATLVEKWVRKFVPATDF